MGTRAPRWPATCRGIETLQGGGSHRPAGSFEPTLDLAGTDAQGEIHAEVCHRSRDAHDPHGARACRARERNHKRRAGRRPAPVRRPGRLRCRRRAVDRCSASLLSATVVLTAAHCTVGTDAARIGSLRMSKPTRSIRSAVPRPTTAPRSRIPTSQPVRRRPAGIREVRRRDHRALRAGPDIRRQHDAELPDEGIVDTLANKTAVDYTGYG